MNINALVLGRVVSLLAVLMIAASSWRTLLCPHVDHPREMAILQELMICSVVCLSWYIGQVGSSFFPYRIRFALEGRRSYTDWWESWSEMVPCARSHSMWGIIPTSPVSLLRLLDCFLNPSGSFIELYLINDHGSCLFRFCLWPLLCYRWPQLFAVTLNLPNHKFNITALSGLIYGFNNFSFPTRFYGRLYCLHKRVLGIL